MFTSLVVADDDVHMPTTVADQIRSRLRVRHDLLTPDKRRALREAAGLTQQELADIVGVTRKAIGNYETGIRYPQGAARDRYAEALRALIEAATPEAA
jgi:DNA-binding XRE family transcriptional regulator